MFNKLLNKIISTKVGSVNYWLATIGICFAITLILTAVFVKQNFKRLKGNNSSYIVISKIINSDMMVDINKSTFAKSEIETLRNTGFFDSIQGTKTSLYKVKLDVPVNTLPLQTDMYFESVPDVYLDVIPKDWAWKPGDNSLKALAPRFLLDMYNYGFAVGQQLPQLSENTISAIPLNITVQNKDASREIKLYGNIGGLSNRYMSIMVPESFMNWANDNFGFIAEKPATRLVAKAKDPTSPEMNSYLRKMGLKTDFGDNRYSVYGNIIRLSERVTSINGLLFLAFALLVFLMFIQLTITNAKQEILLLRTLGTSPKQLHLFLMKRTLPTIFITIISILVVLGIVQLILHFSQNLKAREIALPALIPWQVVALGLLLSGVLVAINYAAIKKYVSNVS